MESKETNKAISTHDEEEEDYFKEFSYESIH